MNQQSKINTEKILHSVRIGLWRLDIEDGKTPKFYADSAMDELLGIDGEVTPEERFVFHRAHIHPDDVQLFQEYADKLSEVKTEVVYRYLHPESGEMMVRCSGMRDIEAKNYLSVIGTHQDISETMRLEREKDAERRLAEINSTLRQEKVMQEDYYRNLLDMQSCGVLAYTMPGHRVIHMNALALKIYGIKNIEAAQSEIGEALKKVYYPDPQTLEHLKRLRKVNEAVDYECIIRKGEEDEYHVLAKTKATIIPTGERAVITTFLDVSDMVVLKEALRKAEEGSRAKSSFLFAMSHDLRTPMNAIIGYADLMERHWDDRELTAKYLKKLKMAGSFLLDLIGNVLEVARIESGKETLSETRWDIRGVKDTLEILLNHEIMQKNLTIKSQVEIQHPYVYCDILKVREILMNLLSNAVKYTPEGGIITVSVRELPYKKEGYALFETTVEDNGIGIGEEYIPHLFEAFTREKSSSENGIKGTGLGLRIVKSFVELMGGEISVESELGKGTRFTVRIPHQIIYVEENETEHLQITQDENGLSGLRILLVEDNALNAEIAMTVLKDAHAEAEWAEDGMIALTMLEGAPVGYYDVILMDIQMPHMNGYQTTRRIRELPDERAKIPVIAMTANAFVEDKQAAFEAGMNGYVTKPVDISELLHIIKEKHQNN